MRVLAVDTTSALGSVALADDSILLDEERLTGPDTHSLHLLPAIERVLEERAVSTRSAWKGSRWPWAPARSPGYGWDSAPCKGSALATGRPCLGVSVLDVLASTSEGVITLTLRDAFRGEVYWAVYDAQGRAMGAPGVGPLAEALAQAPPDASFVGDAAASHRDAHRPSLPPRPFPAVSALPRGAPGLLGRASAARRPGLRAGIASAPLRARRRHPEGVRLRTVFAEAAWPEDAPALAEIEEACVGSGWTARAFEREIRGESSRVVVLRAPFAAADSGDIAAYCVFRVIADEMELLSLAVRPQWRRQGLGRWLARRALTLAAEGGARNAFLEVRSGNAPARRLYASLGFAETRRRPAYYKNPVEDAVVLARALAPDLVSSKS